MADINISTATFTSSDMVLESDGTLTLAYGTALANNTGYLAYQMIPVASFNIPVAGAGDTGSVVQDRLPVSMPAYLSAGSWWLYYSFVGTYGAKFHWYTYYLPSLEIAGYGTTLEVDNSSDWGNKSGSLFYYSNGEHITITLTTSNASNSHTGGYFNLHARRIS